MSTPSHRHCISRRALLGACGVAVCAGAPAHAQKKPQPAKPQAEPAEPKKNSWKVSPESVNYIDKGPLGGGAQICVTCHYYIDPIECLVVEGYVSPMGYCDFYVD